MSTKAIVGLAFGDEGKGKVVDYYAEAADAVVRFGGGPNAGHTLYVDGQKVILRLIPSGIFHKHTKCILAQGMVIDPIVLYKEILHLRKKGVKLEKRLFVSTKAHIITSTNILNDQNGHTTSKIGTTKRGVGPCYADKAKRSGVRVYDLLNSTDKTGLWLKEIAGGQEEFEELQEAIETIRPFVMDTTYLVNQYINTGMNVIFEGAQGAMLDIDHGTYPFVTSSSAVAGGACTGAGVGPTVIEEVLGITKAYMTRVGEGPFPSELEGDEAEALRKEGNEFGSVTKRPRRVGWFDVPITKYACMVNGCVTFALTKLDVLSYMEKIKVVVSYSGYIETDMLSPELSNPANYVTLDGWRKDISEVRDYYDLPKEARAYVEFIEKRVGLPICLISVGPGRDDVIDRSDYVADIYASNAPGSRTILDLN